MYPFEQVCIYMCPWPRIQSAMMDERSLTVTYKDWRGEPRGSLKKAQKSPLKSLEFATLRIKDAVCDRFRDAVGARPSVDRAQPDVRVHAFVDAQRAVLYLDTSGEAPLRENLAAGIIRLARNNFV